jgi:threonine aldolase
MGLYAIDNNVSRIEDDNNHATILASLIKEAKIKDLRMPNVDTNIVMLDLSKLKIPAVRLVQLLATKGIMLHEWSEYVLRVVTNLNVSELDVRHSAKEIGSTIKVLIDQNKLNTRNL